MKGRDGKKEKRSLKHGALLAKIHKNQPSKPARHHKPKNIANLQALADALPDCDPDLHHPPASSSNSVNVIRQKTLRHKPGAQKRRQKLEKLERDRFASNMAQMAPRPDDHHQQQQQQQSAESAEPTTAAGTANRWAALRSFISQTMEHQPVFQGQQHRQT